MKTLSIIIAIILSPMLICAEEANLSPSQVQAIAQLVTTKIYHSKNFTPSQPTYDKSSGTWSCATSLGSTDGGYLFYIRDKDAFYRVVPRTGRGAIEEFTIHKSLKKEITKIIKPEG